jgi:uncharacterized LabA/DUF88 family protein
VVLFFGILMRKVCCFVDGFNLYHAIADLKQNHLKWLDLKKLAVRFIKPKSQSLQIVYYFSAYPTWRAGSYHRHRIYVKALTHSGVTAIMGQFKSKNRKCPKCKHAWSGHEEKETDVNIAVAMLTAAFENRFDDAILISRDSDLAPPINMIKNKFPNKEITVVAPPNLGHCNELVHAAHYKSKITIKILEESLLPKAIFDDGGNLIIERPSEYTPYSFSVPAIPNLI